MVAPSEGGISPALGLLHQDSDIFRLDAFGFDQELLELHCTSISFVCSEVHHVALYPLDSEADVLLLALFHGSFLKRLGENLPDFSGRVLIRLTW